jgi:hypothetical protein
MKQILLSGILCLTLCSFATAQNANLAVSQQLLPIVESAIATHSLQDYCGTYKMADNEYVDKVNIVLKDGHLATKSPEGEEIILEQLDDNIFFHRSLSATSSFYQRERCCQRRQSDYSRERDKRRKTLRE